MTKPPRPNRHRHSDRQRRLRRRHPGRDRAPELTLYRPGRLRPTRRTHRWPQRPVGTPLPTRLLWYVTGLLVPVCCCHRLTPPCSRCCDDRLNPPFTSTYPSGRKTQTEVFEPSFRL